jgi:arylsulfatase A-like enzyme
MPSFKGERSGYLRGCKDSLYEGGTREPFIVRWPGHVPSARVDEKTVIAGIDLFPMFCTLAGVPIPQNEKLDGEDLSKSFFGATLERQHPLFWEYGRNASFFFPKGKDRSPNVAIREGDWKLVINADGTDEQLYNLASDRNETHNVADKNPEIATRLSEAALQWRKAMP